MIDTAWERWAEADAGFEEKRDACGDDFLKLLCLYVDRAGVRVSCDTGRNYTRPCTFCGTSKEDEPRELVKLGTYRDGEDLERPVCARCRPVADMRRLRPVESTLRAGWPGETAP